MDLKDLQAHFTAYLMGRDKRPPPALAASMPKKRLRLYQELVQNTVAGGLDSGFPYARQVIGNDRWRRMKFEFWKTHPPVVWELNQTADAFPQWFEKVYAPRQRDLPDYVAELIDYERLELTTYLHENRPWQGNPALNPTLTLRSYRHQIAQWVKDTHGNLEGEPQAKPSHMAIYRDPDTLFCRFLNLNGLSMATLQHLQDGGMPAALAEEISQSLGLDLAACQGQLIALFSHLEKMGVLRLDDDFSF